MILPLVITTPDKYEYRQSLSFLIVVFFIILVRADYRLTRRKYVIESQHVENWRR